MPSEIQYSIYAKIAYNLDWKTVLKGEFKADNSLKNVREYAGTNCAPAEWSISKKKVDPVQGKLSDFSLILLSHKYVHWSQ
jgi:hypothetical protein